MSNLTERDSMKSNPGNAPIVKVGHTYSGRDGVDPNAKVRGPSTVTEQTFGK